MTLEKYLDNELRKDTSDVIIIDESGNEITKVLPGDTYDLVDVIDVTYEMVARIKIKRS